MHLAHLRSNTYMSTSVLAVGLDPATVDFSATPELTAELVRTFIDSQLQHLRALGYEVESCLIDCADTAAVGLARSLEARRYDCVMIGAGLRAPAQLLLLEKVINLVHARAPAAKICFNTSPADTAEAVQRWV
jgi:hypothetical protein